MPTAAQVYTALTIESTFSILNANTPINFANWTDATDWAALGVSTGAGDTVKIISQTVDPVGQYPYQNAGYQTDVYTSPDTTLLSLTKANYNIFAYSGTTTPIWGTYQVMVKVQVILASDPGNPIYTQKTFSVPLVEGLSTTTTLELTDSCTALTFTSTDVSSYGVSGYTLVTTVRTHTVYPPAVAGQSNVTADAATIIIGSPDNPLWTNATYEAELSVINTYTKNGNTYISHGSTTAEKLVVCTNGLCALKCCLDTLESGYNTYKGTNPTLASQYLQKFTLCGTYYTLIQASLLCANDEDVSGYTASFYATAKPFCDCNCDCSTEPAPATASNIIQGPTGPTGPQGPIGATGATGATGAAGTNAYSVLYNNFAAQATITASAWETLDSYEIPIAQISTNGSEVTFVATYTTPSWTTFNQNTRILFNGSTIIDAGVYPGFYTSNCQKVIVIGRIVRVSNTTAKINLTVRYISDAYVQLQVQEQVLVSLASLNFTTTAYTIAQQAYSAVIGDIVSESLEVIYNQK